MHSPDPVRLAPGGCHAHGSVLERLHAELAADAGAGERERRLPRLCPPQRILGAKLALPYLTRGFATQRELKVTAGERDVTDVSHRVHGDPLSLVHLLLQLLSLQLHHPLLLDDRRLLLRIRRVALVAHGGIPTLDDGHGGGHRSVELVVRRGRFKLVRDRGVHRVGLPGFPVGRLHLKRVPALAADEELGVLHVLVPLDRGDTAGSLGETDRGEGHARQLGSLRGALGVLGGEEENRPVARAGGQDVSVGGKPNHRHLLAVGLEAVDHLEPVGAPEQDTNDTVVESGDDRSLRTVHVRGCHLDKGASRAKFVAVHLALLGVRPEPNRAVRTRGDGVVAHGGDVHAVDAAAVEAGEAGGLANLAILPDGDANDAAVCILHQPVVGLRGDDALDVAEPAGTVTDGSLPDWLDEHFDLVIIGFRVAHGGVVPPPHVPVRAGCRDCLGRVVEPHNLNHTLVAGFERATLTVRPHDHGTDQTTVPYEERSRLGAGDHLTVGELGVARDVGEVDVAEPADVALQLEAREGARHLPEPDVTGTGRVEVPREHGGERYVVNLLRERLASEHDALLVPVPNRDHKVGVVADGGEL